MDFLNSSSPLGSSGDDPEEDRFRLEGLNAGKLQFRSDDSGSEGSSSLSSAASPLSSAASPSSVAGSPKQAFGINGTSLLSPGQSPLTAIKPLRQPRVQLGSNGLDSMDPQLGQTATSGGGGRRGSTYLGEAYSIFGLEYDEEAMKNHLTHDAARRKAKKKKKRMERDPSFKFGVRIDSFPVAEESDVNVSWSIQGNLEKKRKYCTP